jgi:hypothetical protein
MLHRTSHRGMALDRSSKRRLGRAICIDALEQRRLLTVFNLTAVSPVAAEPVEGVAFGTTAPLVATFASNAPSIANLSATVVFPSGTTTATVTNTGTTETIDGTPEPEYNINYTGNWTPPDESPAVPFVVTVVDTTGGGQTSSTPGSVPVRDAPLKATATLVSIGSTEGIAQTYSLVSFTDGNSLAQASDFSATIDWGDGSPQSFGTVTPNAGAFTVTAIHTYLEPASYPVQVLVADKGGSSLSSSSTINVADAPLSNGTGTSFTGIEGQTLSNVLVGTFQDANPSADVSDFSAKINWGDGVADTGAISVIGGDTSGAILGIYGNHTYTDDSITPFNVTVNVTDKGGSTLPTIDSTATISDPLLIMAGGYKVSAVEGTSTGTQKVATFVDPGGNAAPSEYTATVDWGDGTTTAGTITFANGFFSVSGPHTYAHAQSTPYVITTTITHVPGIPQTVTSSATISKAPLKASAVTFSGLEGRSPSVTVSTFTAATSTSASNFTATIDWGDGKTTAGTIVKDATGKYHVAGSHAYAEENSSPYIVKVTVKQSGGATVSVNSKANIADAPLDHAAGVSFSVSKNSTFSNKTLGTFRDQDALNKIAGDYEGTIDWGDGAKSAASFVFTSATSNVGSFWKVTGSHKYTTAKTFTVKITLDDTGSPSKKITITSTIKVT